MPIMGFIGRSALCPMSRAARFFEHLHNINWVTKQKYRRNGEYSALPWAAEAASAQAPRRQRKAGGGKAWVFFTHHGAGW
jgi:hypothetical protein